MIRGPFRTVLDRRTIKSGYSEGDPLPRIGRVIDIGGTKDVTVTWCDGLTADEWLSNLQFKVYPAQRTVPTPDPYVRIGNSGAPLSFWIRCLGSEAAVFNYIKQLNGAC